MSKRRRAREMAVQMLYQSDLGATRSAQVFNSFNPAEYLADGGDGLAHGCRATGVSLSWTKF